ncbi:J domain-containing protein [Umezakia ovalisporum]|uniref:J domain-containing protein n=2 Tax=Umezakia ovalisporum TaxID=75695 RepID=A0AA43GYM3_9CYAN|nr:J domain-containing protein [Umezakia ovalisporum]MBI1240116.1 DnaJ domain-containing protein [Nostoc sp. RI_552]MDH6056592.1 J domain-containing protein [Umezakia ovalisporum FSS-43]MDH6063288.1 J domain-containing protein [Umezakia ovalisporum FSS-62]MDH6066217.1 J domain-containing protein [Umezakia ovalisporum APH033B]MDH6070467.1 J domain-containing protein [Umezakia ovalisporum CobakiLakeA]
MTQNGTKGQITKTTTYYGLLGLHPSASPIDIRRAYWQLSKRYHPDTTELPATVATAKFQQINEAYATLSNPERRLSYDAKIGYSRFGVIQAPTDLNHPVRTPYDFSRSIYLDANDRPLSAGEIFVLFVLGLTLVGCVLVAMAVAVIRGETSIQTQPTQAQITHISPQPTPKQIKIIKS